MKVAVKSEQPSAGDLAPMSDTGPDNPLRAAPIATLGLPPPAWFCLLVVMCCFWMWLAGTDASRM
jgi:hypothetical protein